MYHRTRILAALALLFAAVFAGSVAYASPQAQSETVTVEAADGNVFVPAEITISVGDTVTWENTDDVSHTSTSDDGVWQSGNIAPGESYSYTFDEAGTFGYFCEYHQGMVGAVVVEEAAEEEPAATATPAEGEATEEPEPQGTEAAGDSGNGTDDEGDGYDNGGEDGGTDGGVATAVVGSGDGDADDGGEMPEEAPETGAGGLASGAGVPWAPIAATGSLLLAGAYSVIRRRR